jgi:hypothetical protein
MLPPPVPAHISPLFTSTAEPLALRQHVLDAIRILQFDLTVGEPQTNWSVSLTHYQGVERATVRVSIYSQANHLALDLAHDGGSSFVYLDAVRKLRVYLEPRGFIQPVPRDWSVSLAKFRAKPFPAPAPSPAPSPAPAPDTRPIVPLTDSDLEEASRESVAHMLQLLRRSVEGVPYFAHLATLPHTRRALLDARTDCVDLAVQLLRHPTVDVHRSAAFILAHLALEPEGRERLAELDCAPLYALRESETPQVRREVARVLDLLEN